MSISYAQSTEEAKEELKQKIVVFEEESELISVKQSARTHPATIAQLFYKFSDKQPDFKEWAKQTQEYYYASEIDKKTVMNNEFNKFQTAFRELNRNENVVVLSSVSIGNYSELQQILSLKSLNPETFFRYDAFGSYYAIIPAGIDRFRHIRMDSQRYNEIMKMTRNNTSAYIEVIMKIKDVDSREPMEMEGYPFWLLSADIAEFRIWYGAGRRAELLWRWQADWFDPYYNEDLMNIYEAGRGGARDISDW